MTLTAKIVTAIVIALGIYDLWAVWQGMDYTISHFMQWSGMTAPVIPFVVGYICGHFWGFMPPTCPQCGAPYGRKRTRRLD
jgi:hypothetical protein